MSVQLVINERLFLLNNIIQSQPGRSLWRMCINKYTLPGFFIDFVNKNVVVYLFEMCVSSPCEKCTSTFFPSFISMCKLCLCVCCFQSFLGGLFGPVCEIDVLLNDAENRKTAELKTEDGKVEKHYLFFDGESVSGKVSKLFNKNSTCCLIGDQPGLSNCLKAFKGF